MTSSHADFAYSTAPEPHRTRTKEILRRHPEIRNLIGPSQSTFRWVVGLVGLQFALGWFVTGPLVVAGGPAGVQRRRIRQSRPLRDDP